MRASACFPWGAKGLRSAQTEVQAALLSHLSSTHGDLDTGHPGGRGGREGRACPCHSNMEIQGQALTLTPGRSDQSVGWGHRPVARRGHYSLRSGGICIEVWRPERHAIGLGAPSIPVVSQSVMNPASMRDYRAGSNPVRGRCKRLGVFDLASLSTRRRAAILSVAYRCGQARGTLHMKLLNASKLPRTAKIAG